MEQTPLPPLVSDEELRARRDSREEILSSHPFPIEYGIQSDLSAYVQGSKQVRDEYEQARKSDREVIQALCDALETEENMRRGFRFTNNGTTKLVSTAPSALALAKSQCRIEPTKP